MTPPKKLKALTIDSETTRDRDDAIWVERTEQGWIADVFIALVAPRVKAGKRFDADVEIDSGGDKRTLRGARTKLESRYLPQGKTIPMLPWGLTDRISLNPNVHRKAFLVRLLIGDDLSVAVVFVGVVPVRSKAAIAYHEIPEILKSPESHKHGDMLATAWKLAQGLLGKRRAEGALAIFDLTRGITTTEDGRVVRLPQREDTQGYVLIQELMILANHSLASWCRDQDIPIIWRTHQAKDPVAPEEAMRRVQAALGDDHDVELIDALQGEVFAGLERARYSTELSGHYGLALETYSHFTSPLRRYVDLVNQRQILAHLGGGPVPHTNEDLQSVAEAATSLREQTAKKRSAKYRAANRDRLERIANPESRVDLLSLKPKNFDRLIRRHLEGEPVPGIERVIRRKLAGGVLPVRTKMLVLFHRKDSAWGDLQSDLLNALERRPEEAVSIFVQATQAGVGVGELRFHCICEDGPPHAKIYGYRAEAGDLVSPTAVSQSKKNAQHRAAVALLRVVCELDVPADEQPPEVEAEAPKPTPVVVGQHPVSALYELAAQQGIAQPSFAFKAFSGGFACEAAMGGKTGSGQDTTKKAAKQRAAAELLQEIA